MSQYVAKENVYSKPNEKGYSELLYAKGDPIPEGEARKLGPVPGAKKVKEAADKAVKEPAENKAVVKRQTKREE